MSIVYSTDPTVQTTRSIRPTFSWDLPKKSHKETPVRKSYLKPLKTIKSVTKPVIKPVVSVSAPVAPVTKSVTIIKSFLNTKTKLKSGDGELSNINWSQQHINY